MLTELSDAPLFPFTIIFGALGVLLVFSGVMSFMYYEFGKSVVRVLSGFLLLALGALAGTISIGMVGYRALTREDVAAHIAVKPDGAKRFTATFRFPDGRQATYQLTGDEIYVDAHIIKWHPYANMIGLHTAYELDRVAGRYRDVKDEQSAPRTVHALARQKPVNLYEIRRQLPFIAPVLDTEYGSASYVPVTEPAEFELRVSTTGLLLRPAKPQKP